MQMFRLVLVFWLACIFAVQAAANDAEHDVCIALGPETDDHSAHFTESGWRMVESANERVIASTAIGTVFYFASFGLPEPETALEQFELLSFAQDRGATMFRDADLYTRDDQFAAVVLTRYDGELVVECSVAAPILSAVAELDPQRDADVTEFNSTVYHNIDDFVAPGTSKAQLRHVRLELPYPVGDGLAAQMLTVVEKHFNQE